MKRRMFLRVAGAALAAPSIVRAAGAAVIKFVPQSDLGSIDPHWSPDGVARNHGFMIYDTLYGLSIDLEPSPQMAAGEQIEDDGRIITITLRDGLMFHDGERVRAADCVASILRWSKRSSFGQKLASQMDELVAVDDKRLRFRLKKPFPLLKNALAAVTQAAVIMPERVAKTDPFKQVTEVIGSGPFRFIRDEFISGSLIVYDRNPSYIPLETGVASLTAGPKRVHFDRVEWHVIPDGATAAAALRSGEIDFIEQLNPDQQGALKGEKSVSVELISSISAICILRLNFLQPPFNNKAARQSLLSAVSQENFMAVAAGDELGAWQQAGLFSPGTPMATMAGMDPLLGPRNVTRSHDHLMASGYRGELARLLGPTDRYVPAMLAQVADDLLRRTGFKTELALSDWGTVIQRRTNREPVEKGGWSAFASNLPGYDCAGPAGHVALRGNGTGPGNFVGWPTIPRLEELRDAWFDAPDLAARQAICADIQRTSIEEVSAIPLGAIAAIGGLRRDLVDRVNGIAAFWGIRRA